MTLNVPWKLDAKHLLIKMYIKKKIESSDEEGWVN